MTKFVLSASAFCALLVLTHSATAQAETNKAPVKASVKVDGEPLRIVSLPRDGECEIVKLPCRVVVQTKGGRVVSAQVFDPAGQRLQAEVQHTTGTTTTTVTFRRNGSVKKIVTTTVD